MTLTRRDWIFIAVCLAVTVASLLVIGRWFGEAFPEASIEFEFDRNESRQVAIGHLRALDLDTRGMKHTVVFESDQIARIFLERTLGLQRANRVMTDEVLVWYWRHRWFVPLQEEEYAVEIAPTGELVAFSRTLPEAAAMPATAEDAARHAAEQFLARAGIDLATIEIVSQSERQLPARMQRIFTWESKSIRPGGAPYRYVATVDGGQVSSFARRLRVPEEWIRGYREMRSKNEATGRVDLVFMLVTMLAALAVFIARIRRGDLQIRFLLVIGAVTAVLVAGVTLNSLPSAMAGYDTTTSYPAFIAQIVILTIVQSIGSAMLLIVICGAGEVLYRERLPQHLAIPRLWTKRTLTSKRVFLSLILGYALVGFFIAYQVAFYIGAAQFGAWAPADLPYDDILNTAFPWIAVLFAGFFPAFSEEFLSRAFSIPFFERIVRSRAFAIVLAGFIWGFGHATYPQQPFYIRGIEVGLAGVLIGLLMYRYGLLSLLIWHYTVDAVYTSLLLFRSGNTYYVVSAAVASLVFALPLVVSIVLYIRNRGFVADDELSNAALPVAPPLPPAAEPAEAPLPPAIAPSRRGVVFAIGAAATAAALVAVRPETPQDIVNYRIDSRAAKEIAIAHLDAIGEKAPSKIAAIPVSGFRSWSEDSGREDGGAPGAFDDIAATYMVQHGMPVSRLSEVMRDEIPSATWMVRVFTPEQKTEYFIEIDPREARVVSYHKYAEETAPGATLEQGQALAIARATFERYGVNQAAFDVREALSFQQPNRRDWLFHFEKKQPLVAEARHRVTVRVMGAEVTQFVNTIRVPESVYREASEQTLLTIVLLALKLIGIMIALSLVVAGAIIVTRHGGAAWRRAGRITAALAIIPVASAAARVDRILFSYNTASAWETFSLNVVTEIVRTAGVQILLLFLALAGIFSVHPYAKRLFAREGRVLFGRAAAASAVAAIALFVIFDETMRWITIAFRSRLRVDELSIPGVIGMPLPSLFELADAIISTIIISGAVLLYAAVISRWQKQWAAAAVSIFVIFTVAIDTDATSRDLPVMMIAAFVAAAVVWVIARYVLNGNLLAWPAAALLASLLQSAAALLHHDHIAFRSHGLILAALAIATVAALLLPRSPLDVRSDTHALP